MTTVTTPMQFPIPNFDPGTFTVELQDNNGAPATVLEASAPINISCSWVITALTASVLGGQWEVSAYAESIGPGPEPQLGSTLPVPVTPPATTYNALLTVPAGALPDQPQDSGFSGAYKVVVLLTHRNGGVATDLSAVAEFPVVRIG